MRAEGLAFAAITSAATQNSRSLLNWADGTFAILRWPSLGHCLFSTQRCCVAFERDSLVTTGYGLDRAFYHVGNAIIVPDN
ncbi:MAG TPA: hypothetical protein DEF45_26125 [Rhodopirellula sp.]|nr:hypothetical protein [Rhodopirellula sp.]